VFFAIYFPATSFSLGQHLCSVENIQVVRQRSKKAMAVRLPLLCEVEERAGVRRRTGNWGRNSECSMFPGFMVRWCSGAQAEDFYRAQHLSNPATRIPSMKNRKVFRTGFEARGEAAGEFRAHRRIQTHPSRETSQFYGRPDACHCIGEWWYFFASEALCVAHFVENERIAIDKDRRLSNWRRQLVPRRFVLDGVHRLFSKLN